MQPSLKRAVSWKDKVSEIEEIIGLALQNMLNESILPREEELPNSQFTLNRAFYDQIRTQILKKGFNPRPSYNAENEQSKKPDISWAWTDSTGNINKERIYHVECKRLDGTSFQGNYVSKGLYRFVLDEYAYGKSQENGAMVAYVQSAESLQMVCDDIVRRSNLKRQNDTHVKPLTWENNNLTQWTSILIRNPTDIKIMHFWLDLRQKY